VQARPVRITRYNGSAGEGQTLLFCSTRLAACAASVAVVVAGVGVTWAQSQLPFVVIVHPDNSVAGLTRSELSSIFLQERGQWADGTAVEPVDQAGSSELREAFSLEIHNRAAANIRSYWQQQIFSGGKVPPVEVEGDSQVIELVSQRRGAIGYVSAAAELTGVKAVGVIAPPVAITRVPAEYTAMARRFRIEGDVRLRVTVAEDGRVGDVEVLEGLQQGLTEQAIRAVKKWRFEPATAGDRPVSATVDVTVQFRL